MKHLIMGTAGHVDHGKTTLIKALTGIDCDTHPEEKERGITINPGFAHLDLPDDGSAGPQRIGIVDVPGHQRFIHNMLAGACSVDFALLTVAADDGVMPQTTEHIAILENLGVADGLVAITKSDLAGGDLVGMAVEETREALSGTFLKDAEIIPVSALTGAGIGELIKAIEGVVARLPERECSGTFRMYIDRAFSVAGFGTVVTGSVMGGRIRSGDTLYVAPKGIEVRVRRIENHGKEVQEVVAGDRASLNLAGFACSEFEKGMLLADRLLDATPRVDAELRLIDPRAQLKLYSKALFYAGTHESICRIHLLDRDLARSGEKVLAQIELERPPTLQTGDRFILRSCSADRTLGGGRVIDPAPLHHRRRTAELIEQVRSRAEGGLKEQIASEVRKHITFVGIAELAQALGRKSDDIAAAIEEGDIEADIISITTAAGGALLSATTQERMWRIVRRALVERHHQYPLSSKGLDAASFAARLGVGAKEHGAIITEGLLQMMSDAGKIVRSASGGWLLAGFKPAPTRAQEASLSHLRKRFSEARMNVASLSDLESEVEKQFKIGAKDSKILLKHLAENGEIVPIEDVYVWRETVDRCRMRLLEHLHRNKDGTTVAQFRDIVNGNRRICLLLIGLYDREGLTRREGDFRFITQAGTARLAQSASGF
ncbi:MAG: selenocysteine-specific translation elongation factor [Pseudomonadota bacterium]